MPPLHTPTICPWKLVDRGDSKSPDAQRMSFWKKNQEERIHSLPPFSIQELKGNREIVMKAVMGAPFALLHATDELRGDRDIVMSLAYRAVQRCLTTNPTMTAWWLRGSSLRELLYLQSVWALGHAFRKSSTCNQTSSNCKQNSSKCK